MNYPTTLAIAARVVMLACATSCINTPHVMAQTITLGPSGIQVEDNNQDLRVNENGIRVSQSDGPQVKARQGVQVGSTRPTSPDASAKTSETKPRTTNSADASGKVNVENQRSRKKPSDEVITITPYGIQVEDSIQSLEESLEGLQGLDFGN